MASADTPQGTAASPGKADVMRRPTRPAGALRAILGKFLKVPGTGTPPALAEATEQGRGGMVPEVTPFVSLLGETPIHARVRLPFFVHSFHGGCGPPLRQALRCAVCVPQAAVAAAPRPGASETAHAHFPRLGGWKSGARHPQTPCLGNTRLLDPRGPPLPARQEGPLGRSNGTPQGSGRGGCRALSWREGRVRALHRQEVGAACFACYALLVPL